MTRIYFHFTFEQEIFKKEFLISNKVARQSTKTDTEKNFYELMNNSNFGSDCRNNFYNCSLSPVTDELEEMSYIRKHQSVFDSSVKDFLSRNLLEKQINDVFDNEISQIELNSDFYDAKKKLLELQKKNQLDSIRSIKNVKKKNHQRHNLEGVDKLIQDLECTKKTKMIYEIHPQHTASIKALGVQQNASAKPSTRFSIDKMLMFAKLSLKSFIYDLCKTFMFPNQKTKAIYQKYDIDYIYVYQVLTDTESISLQFIIFCKEECKIPDSMFREILFKVIVKNKVLERFDVSHEFWEQFGVRDVKT